MPLLDSYFLPFVVLHAVVAQFPLLHVALPMARLRGEESLLVCSSLTSFPKALVSVLPKLPGRSLPVAALPMDLGACGSPSAAVALERREEKVIRNREEHARSQTCDMGTKNTTV